MQNPFSSMSKMIIGDEMAAFGSISISGVRLRPSMIEIFVFPPKKNLQTDQFVLTHNKYESAEI